MPSPTPTTVLVFRESMRAVLFHKCDLLGGNLRVMLLDGSYRPAVSHKLSALRSCEVSGKGYEAGGASLKGCRIEETRRGLCFYADDATWKSATITAKYAAIHDGTTAVCVTDLNDGELVSSTNAPFIVRWNPDGIFEWETEFEEE